MNIVNLTPHALTLRTPQGEREFPPMSTAARVMYATRPEASLRDGIPLPILEHPTAGRVIGLPAPANDTIYLVSLIVLPLCAGRTDVFAPATGPGEGAIRDDRGQVVAVTRLVAAPEVA